ncbi:UDP-glucose:glycoprotein glucosyltransferase-domain-containing protein [Mycotypha africana]|uniref:UDP-glucose:glycoprotein glucosyltransferase-domain-containing protein n=1 Tax=Mycotypha africana TaxID=64632 RepID=UPI0023001794|nr:UDP-glucose:glycoprotein glucosyltransferase-domain-containing protein [Mycotypha africana]KAI8968326.1 UDP-glucose:glycoprotein glucosyltransferase-domain-containing protein [Mycotypha africana]
MIIPRIRRSILGLVTVGICTLSVNAESTQHPTVDLTMVAPWLAPNFVNEIAETIANHNETLFQHLIEEFVALEQKASLKNATPYQIYRDTTAMLTTSRMSQEELGLFNLALALHEAAPRIQAFHQYYREGITRSLSNYDDGCDTWIQYLEDQQFCEWDEFYNAFKKSQLISAENSAPAAGLEILPFDHIVKASGQYANPRAQTPVSIALYTDRFSDKFNLFYRQLKQLADDNDISFVLRYRPMTDENISTNAIAPLYLSGYGVEMALKKTDYLVIDDRESQSRTSMKDKMAHVGKKIAKSASSLFESGQLETIEPVTPVEIHRLSFKAAQYVARSNKPLEILTELLNDFPKYAKSLSEIDLDESFAEEIIDNQLHFLRAGMNAIWLNGKGLEFNQVDPFYLLRAIRSELKLINSFKKFGFTPKEAIEIISNPELTAAHNPGEKKEEVYDIRDTSESHFITWWNDLEKDKKYKDWTNSMDQYIRPNYAGQIFPIRKNIFHLVHVEDLSNVESLFRIVNEVNPMIKRLVPMRFGFVPVVKGKQDISTVMATLSEYFIQEYGKAVSMKFLTNVLDSTRAEAKRHPTIDIVKESFEKTAFEAGKPKTGKSLSFEDACNTQDTYIQTVREFLRRMGITELKAEDGLMFLNGRLVEFTQGVKWVQILMPVLGDLQRSLQKMVFMREFDNKDFNYYDHIMEQLGVLRNRNSYIKPTNAHPLRFEKLDNTRASDKLVYFQKDEKTAPVVNLWVSANLDTVSGLKMASEALKFASSHSNVRVALIHNLNETLDNNAEMSIQPIKDNIEPSFSDLLAHLIFEEKKMGLQQLQELIESAAVQSSQVEADSNQTPLKATVPGSPIVDMVAKEHGQKWTELVDALAEDGLSKPFCGIVFNNRVIGPFQPHEEFSYTDYESLFELEYNTRVEPIMKAIRETGHSSVTGHSLADVLSDLAYLIETDKADAPDHLMMTEEPLNRQRVYNLIPGKKYTRLVVGDPKASFLEIGLIIDPLCETAQKWVPIINTLSKMEGVSVIMHLNPVNGLNELPLKRFYRYVFDAEPHFDPTTGVQEIPTAYFEELPTEALYTLGVETTNAWHVTVREANMDLDNIVLKSLSTDEHGVSALYELENILLEGHCLDINNKAPPRGLEFEITSPSNGLQKDTLVMANLGYFQLKALPGVWDLHLREGRSTEVYSITDISSEGKWNWDANDKNETVNNKMAIYSFEGLTVLPLVHKNPGMEHEDVLNTGAAQKMEDKEKSGLWSSISNKFFGQKEKHTSDKGTGLVAKRKQADINIFSVASGKLYERFLSIMIASVMKHTESTVKFWFIENFLSPEFKDFVPHMAEEYNFDYEMITYKWPAWLRTQREKQRTIWGYKILFLDVLFPLNLDKVIFVDADQIVRTDLQELVDMDLQGAPYGYTPFCSDRTEMDGFRFWKEGYWAQHLRGKPYHISALYVVDLHRFRQMAAGDVLRAHYQQLSADPNSLANLDQDLPNNMQHLVPIFSLPQEWLWCETWCSDESLKTAKTIDLCNNPLTKEPKLDRARRQVPEWESYDKEIDALRKRITPCTPIIANEFGDQTIIHAREEHDDKHIKDEL